MTRREEVYLKALQTIEKLIVEDPDNKKKYLAIKETMIAFEEEINRMEQEKKYPKLRKL